MFHKILSIVTIILFACGNAIATDRCFVNESSTAVINVKDFGAVGDGNVDDTHALQKALDSVPLSGAKVIIPRGVYMVDALRGIQIRSNTKVFLDSDSYLKAIPNSSGSYSIARISNAENVTMVGGHLTGERYEHSGQSGEWGMGLSIRKSKNVIIKTIKTTDNWGDGFYISDQSSDIYFCSVTADGNRRQGMSIISGKNINIIDSTFKNTNGKNPQAGIDIEPNVGDFVYDVKILNSKFLNNGGAGIMSYVAVGNNKASVTDVLIEGNIFSENGFRGAIASEKKLIAGGGLIFKSTNVKMINNIFMENNGSAIYFDKETRGGTIEENTIHQKIPGEHDIKNMGINTIYNNIIRN